MEGNSGHRPYGDRRNVRKIEQFGELGVQKAIIKMATPHDTRHVDLVGALAEAMA